MILIRYGVFLLVAVSLILTIEARPGRRSRNRGHSWGGYEDSWSWGRADANTGGSATGDQTGVDTGSDASVDNGGRGRASSRGSGWASGRGSSKVDLESFAAGGRSEGTAGTGGSSTGEQSAVNSETVVNVGQGNGDFSYTSGSGTASGRGVSAVDLESFAALDNEEATGSASAKAVGRDATSVAGAIAVKAEENNVRVGSAGSASAGGSGKVGAQSSAGAENAESSLNLSSKAIGDGQQVLSGSQSNTGLSHGETSGVSSSFAKSTSKDGSGAFAESGAKLETGGK